MDQRRFLQRDPENLLILVFVKNKNKYVKQEGDKAVI